MNSLLTDQSVHIWYAEINSIPLDQELMHITFSDDEIRHANQLKSEQDRISFLSRHYMLRSVLCKYCKCLPRELKFKYNQYRKPAIDLPGKEYLKFNVSYSGGLMLVGITNNLEVGVDIEEIKQLNKISEIASDHFSPEEFAFFNDNADQTRVFYRIWTCKEAYIKGIGMGLFYPLKSFSINLCTKDISQGPSVTIQNKKQDAWKITELDVKNGFVASMAVKTSELHIAYYHFSLTE